MNVTSSSSIALLVLCLLPLQFFLVVFGAVPPYGQLRVSGGKLVGSNGQPVALHGMSLFWSSFPEGPSFFTADVVKQLKCNWNANLVRAVMGIEVGNGYLSNKQYQMSLVEAVIKGAIDNGIYVLVDWQDFNAQDHQSQAIEFFTYIAQTYGNNPHIIYEPFNEPLQVDWTSVVRPYHVAVVAAIRARDPDNVIVLGTPTWSTDVDLAANNPISGINLCYTVHFYAGTHKQSFRDKMQAALNKGVCVFVTEYGTVNADGNGAVDQVSTQEWYTYMDNNKISYANWALDAKDEGSAALKPGTLPSQISSDSVLTASGSFVKSKLKSQNNGVSCSGSSSGGGAAVVTNTTTKAAATTTKAPSSGGGSASVSVSVATVSTWNGGGQYNVVIKNTGSKAVCKVVFKLNLSVASIWNADGSGSGPFTTASWINIPAGGSTNGVGFTVNGNAPSVSLVSATAC